MKNISFIQLTFLFLGLGLMVFSCKKDTEVTLEPTDPGTVENISDYVSFFADPNEESDRLTMLNESIVLADTSLERDQCTKYSAWTKIGEVSTLFSIDGQIMSATHVSQVGNLIAITYHLRGADYNGAVEIVDISNPASPKFKGYIELEDADVNSVILEANPAGPKRSVWVALANKKERGNGG